MKLTAEQQQEVASLVSGTTKYRETYDEVYDHVLNRLMAENQVYSFTLVDEILAEDFGGGTEILANEIIHAKRITKQYFRLFKGEIINAFKWPQLPGNLVMIMSWVFLYYSTLKTGFNTKPINASIGIIAILMCLFYYLKRYYLDRKLQKPSIKYSFLQASTSIGVSFYVFMFFWFLSPDSIVEISRNLKTILVLSLFCCTSIYLRAFIKLYNKKIKVLAV